MKKKPQKLNPIPDATAYELHELYGKHYYQKIGKDNVLHVCDGCGSWRIKSPPLDMLSCKLVDIDAGSLFGNGCMKGNMLSYLGVRGLLNGERRISFAKYMLAAIVKSNLAVSDEVRHVLNEDIKGNTL